MSHNEFDPYALDPDAIEAPPPPPRAEEVVFGQTPPTPQPATPAPVEGDNGAPVGLIVGIAGGVCAVVGGGAYMLMKKKKSEEKTQ